MEQIGRRYKMRRGESGVYDCTITEQDGSPYIISTNIDNPYLVVNIKSNIYHNKDFYNLNIWQSLKDRETSDEFTFKLDLPSTITYEWVEQQYLISITVVGGVTMLDRLQGMYKSLYYDDWRYDENDIPIDIDTLYNAIEFKAPDLLKGIVKDMPLASINYKEEIISDRVLLVND